MSLDSKFKRTFYWANDIIHGAKILNMYLDSKRVDSNF